MTLTEDENYERALDDIFSSYMSVKELIKGKFDREVRDPRIIIDALMALELIPPERSIIRVTGSKGKGTTSRVAAAEMKRRFPNKRVGLLISPEEIGHLDRMRIDGTPISRKAFLEHYEFVRPALTHSLNEHRGRYLSPSGTFFAIALSWFKAECTDYLVLESGRGVEFDEVGQVASRVSIITSILHEHPEYLGPTTERIARDKLSIGANSEYVVVGQTAEEWNATLRVIPKKQTHLVTLGDSSSLDYPRWFLLDVALARAAVDSLIGTATTTSENSHHEMLSSASFGTIELNGRKLWFEGIIAADSIDRDFYLRRQKASPALKIIASLPDDKDIDGIIGFFQNELGVEVSHIVIEAKRGYLQYDITKKRYASKLLACVEYTKPWQLRDILNEVFTRDPSSSFFFIGTQSFLRLLKLATMEIAREQ